MAVSLFAATISFIVGGFRFEVSGFVVSVRQWLRPAAIGVVLALVRQSLQSYGPILAKLREASGDPLPSDEAALFAREPYSLWRRIGGLVALTIGFSIIVAISTWPQAAEPYSVSDRGDPLFSIWRLSWVKHALFHDPLNLFNANQFYPEPRTLTYSDPVLYPAALFIPLTWLGIHRIVAYNLVFLAGGVFSGVGTYLLVKALTGRKDAAFIAGAIFAVDPFRVGHFAHLELQMTVWMPLALLWLHRAMASGRLRDGIMAGVLFGVQMISALYYGSFLIPYMTALGMALWIGRGCPKAPLRNLAAGLVVAAVIIAPVGLVYLKTKPYMGPRPVEAVRYYSAEGPDYLKAHERSWTYHSWARNAQPERSNFPRFTPVVLAAVALWPPLSLARIAYALCLALTFEASLGYNGRVFPILYEYVPPFTGIRVPARFSIAVGLTLSILAGYGAARIFRRWPRARTPLVALILAAITYEALPRIILEPVWKEPPPVYAPLIGKPSSVLAEFPMPAKESDAFAEFNYLYFATFHWQKLVNGQSGWLPPTYEELLKAQQTFPSDEAIAYLRTRDVEYITVHGAFYDPDEYKRIVAVLDARTDTELMHTAVWEERESRLYRLR